jgi:tetratricopeptide (TPR) repeat protein
LRTHWTFIVVVLVLGWGIAQTAFADSAEEADDAIASAMDDADEGRCDEAYRRLARAGVDGTEGRARLIAGKCRIRTGLYPEALDDLDRARGEADLDSEQAGDVELYRAVALYHLERYTEAGTALEKADGRTGEEAQLELYRGFLWLRNGDNDRAAIAFESAARLSSEETEPVASFYAGQAWLAASERTKARTAFQRVVDIDADGLWGKEAAKYLESTELFPYFVRGRVGIEYDDNVILRGGVTQFVEPGSGLQITQDGEKDWRGAWRVETGVQLFKVGDLSGGVTGGYSGNAHYDLTDFNAHFPTVGGFLSQRLDPNTRMQARYQFGFAWVDEDSFLRAHVAELGLSHVWPKAGTTVLLADVVVNDLRFDTQGVQDGPPGGGDCVPPLGQSCGPPGLDEGRERDRDGVGVSAAVEHRYPVRVPNSLDDLLEEIEIGGGYRFRYYDSQGDEWKHMAHIVDAHIEIELPLDFRLSTRASLEYRDFLNPSTFPDNETVNEQYSLSGQDREEYEVTFEAEVEKDLNENMSLSVRWSYMDNESNRRVYDYTRNIVGGYLNFRFD